MVSMNRLFSLTANGPTPSTPLSGNIFYGQHVVTDTDFSGPLGGAGDAAFVSPRGHDLHPTGSGRWVYVDAAATGANNGTSLTDAYTTIQAAIDDHQAGDCILVEPGVYAETTHDGLLRGPHPNAFGYTKENEATATDRVKICRRGAGKVEITATELVGTWVPCVSGDADNNPNWASMWKATFTPSTPAATIPFHNRVLTEPGYKSFNVVSGPGYTSTNQMYTQNDATKWWDDTNATFTSNQVGSVVTLTSTIFGAANYPQGSLDDAIVEQHFAGANNTSQCVVTSHDAATGEIVFDFGGFTYDDGTILLNVAHDIFAAGQWASKDNGDGSYTLYYWPHNSANLSQVRITERTSVFEMSAAQYWTFYGLDFTGAGGTLQHTGVPVRSAQNTGMDRYGLIFEECRSGDASGDWCIGMDLSRCPGIRIQNCSFTYCVHGKGVSLTKSPDGWIDQCDASYLGNTAVNLSGARQQVFSYSRISNCRSTHGNGMSLYIGTRDLVVWGNYFDTGFGIAMTNQSASYLTIGMNLIVAPEGDAAGHRGIENNSAYAAKETGAGGSNDHILMEPLGTILVTNNTVVPWVGWNGVEGISGIVTGKTTFSRHFAHNNLAMGSVDPAAYATINPGTSQRDPYYPVESTFGPSSPYPTGTFYSSFTPTGDGIVPDDPQTMLFQKKNVGVFTSGITNPFYAEVGSTNARELTPDEVWTDWINGDYTPKAGSVAAEPGHDVSADLPTTGWIADIIAEGFTYQWDVYGNAFSWATAHKGAIAA